MKKLYIITLLVSMFLASGALAQGPIDVTIPNTSANVGDYIEIPVTIGDISGLNVYSFDIWITFDESVLDITDNVVTTGTISDTLTLTENVMSNEVRLSAYNVYHPINDSGTLFKLGFNVVGSIGDQTQLEFTRCFLNAGTPSTNPQNGTFEIPGFYLTVTSPRGNPQGEGWYGAGLPANFSVDSEVTENNTKYKFVSWTNRNRFIFGYE
jgi:hypothetical protein